MLLLIVVSGKGDESTKCIKIAVSFKWLVIDKFLKLALRGNIH